MSATMSPGSNASLTRVAAPEVSPSPSRAARHAPARSTTAPAASRAPVRICAPIGEGSENETSFISDRLRDDGLVDLAFPLVQQRHDRALDDLLEVRRIAVQVE